MTTGAEREHPFFEPDHYTAINNRYFRDLRACGQVEIDASGWIETQSRVATLKWPAVQHLPLGRYYMDEWNTLGDVRSQLHRLLVAWDGQTFEADSFTVVPSVGVASLLTMAVLRRNGVKRIIFETPCYFAAILQAEWLGIEVVLIPTFRRDNYQRPGKYEQSIKRKPTAWWLTQPRVALGFNQEITSVQGLLRKIGIKDYVVIDEALDQTFPSHLGTVHQDIASRRLIRIKGFGKPLGLNGYRLAFILHNPQLRAEMVDCLETFAGGVDSNSLAAACSLAERPCQLRTMMSVANQQVVQLRLAGEKISFDSNVTINPLINGYIGSAIVNLSALGSSQPERRHKFLTGCQKRGMPVIIGPSMHFACDLPTEAVRLNYFSKREHILRCVIALQEIAAGLI